MFDRIKGQQMNLKQKKVLTFRINSLYASIYFKFQDHELDH